MHKSLVALFIVATACAPAQSRTSVVSAERTCQWDVPGLVTADTVVEDAKEQLGGWKVRFTEGGARYPRALLGVKEGHVLSSFVIDTLGAVMPGSVRIIEESDYAFGESVCTWLRTARFAPLRLEGRARTVLVRRFRYGFTLR
jgi:hypothetical protein